MAKHDPNKGYPIGATLARLIANITRQNKKVYTRFAVYTLSAAVYPLFAVAMPKLVLDALAAPGGTSLAQILTIVGLLFAGAALFGYLRTYMERSTYILFTYLRMGYLKDICTKMLRMDYQYIEDAGFGNRYERAMEAPSSNGNGIEAVYHELFECPAEVLTALALIVLIGAKSPWILLSLFVHLATVIFVGRRVHAYRHSLDAEVGRANRRRRYYLNTTHDFGYGKDIRIYSLKDRILANFRAEIDSYVGIFRSIARREFWLGMLALVTLLVSDVVTYGVLIRDTTLGMPIADFSMYLTAVITLAALLKSIATRVTKIVNEGHYVHDFFVLIDTDLEGNQGDLPAVQNDTLQIEFRNVSFKYPNTDRYIIRNLNLTIEKGERLAIVGINGAGKTTLVKLMCGLFDVTEGEILINGMPLTAYNRQALFSMYSAVFQDVNVLAYTLLQNVSCDMHGDRTRAEDALIRAGLGDKLKTLPKGLDQPMLKIIEEDGTEFSGGESQKLAIARALYKNANMVIMDEPTAALDALAEADIYQHFSDLVAGKTAVYISHRLASTKFCDRIAFFDADGLKEYGSHDELMALRGSYHHMFTVQGKYYNQSAGGAI